MPYFLQSTTEIIKNNTIKNILKYVMETKRLEIPGV